MLTGMEWIGEVSGSVEAAYDSDFRVALAVNGVDTVTFGYDGDGLLTRAGALSATRDLTSGRLSGTTLGSVTTAQGYNGFGELTSLSATYSGTALLELSYTRDALGRIETKTEVAGSDTTVFAYGYDLAGRLETVERDGVIVEAYIYDPNGNRLTFTGPGGVVTATYDAQDRLVTYGTRSYEYTLNGELTRKVEGSDTTEYGYDPLGNLLKVDLPDGTAIDYVVDGVGRRVGRKVNGVLVQEWLYQDGLNPVAELDGTGAVVNRFVYGTRANVPDHVIRGADTLRVVADELGNDRQVVNVATRVLVHEFVYDAWGRVLVDTNPGWQPFGYAGGLYDPITGLVRFGARDYDAEVGRWTQKDPIGFGGSGTNLYSYVLNSPIDFIDPSGLCRIDLGLKVVRRFGVNTAWRHACVLVTDPAGGQTSYRAGPLGPGTTGPTHARRDPYELGYSPGLSWARRMAALLCKRPGRWLPMHASSPTTDRGSEPDQSTRHPI